MGDIRVSILWHKSPSHTAFEVVCGQVRDSRVVVGEGQFRDGPFTSTQNGPVRIDLTIGSEGASVGANATLVRVKNGPQSFTFMLRDVRSDFPILIRAYAVAVTTADDKRSYAEIQQAVSDRKQLSNLQQIEKDPEESFEEAAKHTRSVECPIWMGVSRDVRIFEMGLRYPMHVTDYIQPRFHGLGYFGPNVPEAEKQYLCDRYGFVAGRGWECTEKTWRYLDDGSLPILHMVREDDELRYELTAFATLERSVLVNENIRGTHYLVADGLSVCHAFTEEQEKQYQSLRDKELNRDEETVLCCRIVAVNNASVPRYAMFKAVHPLAHYGYMNQPKYDFEGDTGFAKQLKTGQVFAISKLDGNPLPQTEIAVLVAPGKTCVYEFMLPHRPISHERAVTLARQDVQQRLSECRAFWKNKLAGATKIELPEKRIENMVNAGLLQLDLITYGHEPRGTLVVTNGAYSAVSSEVWENIAFYDSLGLHDLARRCYEYFFEKQHENGFMQNFLGYMLDTGCVLFGLGLHYRYTRDDAWAKAISANVIKACQYLLKWRDRNQREELRGKGYGLLEGQVADPEDNERIYMLNAFAYAGFRGAASLLAKVDSRMSQEITEQADQFKTDLRSAFLESLAAGPVIPLADGTWSPTAAPWVGPSGPMCLFLEPKAWWTHGSATVRDDILGPIQLICREVFAPDERAVEFVLNYSNELMFSRNVASSQPYYLQQPELHLRRGEPKAFLKSYYNAFSALADRETYSWWEHYFHASPHKTHETAGFLMQTRHMLWMEDNDTLKLLAGVPRAWLQSGKFIDVQNAGSFFGHLSFKVSSHVDSGNIEATITCHDPQRKPRNVTIRLPHPLAQRPSAIEGGQYNEESETVTIKEFSGKASVRLRFAV
jgi:hypothetical protein